MSQENEIEEIDPGLTESFLPSDGAPCAPSSVAEMEALESAIQHNAYEIARVQTQLEIMHRKQAARRQELGFQKARMGMKLSRVSHTPIEGAEMIVVQTDGGIATRWIRPANRAFAGGSGDLPTKPAAKTPPHEAA
jgi:hypothetical protein